MNEIKKDSNLQNESKAMRRIYDNSHRNLGLSQVKLGRLYGIEPPTVSNYLNGKIPLNLEFALFFASQFNVQLEDFSPRLAEKYHGLTNNTSRHLPIIDSTDINAFLKDPFQSNDQLMTYVECSPSSFWYKLANSENKAKKHGFDSPSYLLVLVDPKQTAKTNEYALFMNQHISFKKVSAHQDIPSIGKVLSIQYPDSIFTV